jgi:hypothetical protein
VFCPVFLEDFPFVLDGRIESLGLDLVMAETGVPHPGEWMDTVRHALALVTKASGMPGLGFFAFKRATWYRGLEDGGFWCGPVGRWLGGFAFNGLSAGHGC